MDEKKINGNDVEAVLCFLMTNKIMEENNLCAWSQKTFSGLLFSMLIKYACTNNLTDDELIQFVERDALSTLSTLRRKKEEHENI